MSGRRLDAYRAQPWPLLLGHRGSRTRATENTLEAIEIAAAAGADGIEVDVRTCQSGELVVFHDPTVERLGDGVDRRAIADMPLSEICDLKLAAGARVPSLAQVLDCCRHHRLAVNVEMKSDVPSRRAVALATARALTDGDPGVTVVVSSFDPFMLGALRLLAPEVPTALLIGDSYRPLNRLARAMGSAAIHPERGFVSPQRLRRWKRQGLRVVVWTVNQPAEAFRLLSLGVDGIISDDPELLRPVLLEHGKRS